MSIRTLLLLVLGAFAALLLPSAATELVSSVNYLRTIHQAAELNAGTDRLLATNIALARERGQARMFVAAALAGRPYPMDQIEKLRIETDAALSSAEAAIAVLNESPPGRVDFVIKIIGGARQRLEAIRARVNAAVLNPQGTDDPYAWHIIMGDLITQNQRSARLLRYSLTGDTAISISHGLGVKESLSQMIETLGSERALISPILESERRPTTQELRRLDMLKGKLERDFAIATDGAIYLGTDYEHRVKAMTTALDAFDSMRRTELDAGINGRPYPVTSPDWSRQTTMIVDELRAVHQTATDDVSGTVEREQRRTLSGLWAAGLRMLAALTVLACGSLLTIFRISLPLERATSALRRLSEGDVDVRVEGLTRKDEIGSIAAAIQAFKETLVREHALEMQAEEARSRHEIERASASRTMADEFEDALAGFVQQVANAAANLQGNANDMASAARHVSVRSKEVANSSEQAAARFALMGQSAEGLGIFVSDVGRRVDKSEELARTAAGEVSNATSCANELAQSTAKIADVATMIATIAGQTNLLALNATIEAARAGEAGRGFAVVASEVEQLASATANAMEVITREVHRIESWTRGTVAAVETIGLRVDDIDGDARLMAAAIDDQIGLTRLILDNLGQATRDTSEVKRNIAEVAHAAKASEGAAQEVLVSAEALAVQAKRLSGEVGGFLSHLRAS